MSLAVSSSAPHLGQVPLESNRNGIRRSLVPDVALKLSAQGLDGAATHTPIAFMLSGDDTKHAVYLQQRTVENVKAFKVTGSQTPVAAKPSAETASGGVCTMIRTDDGVAEFRGPSVHGIVRFAQMNEHETQIEASFDGLAPGPHSWSVNEFGDVREGAASTGHPYSPFSISAGPSGKEEAPGLLGTLMADSSGHAEHSSSSSRLAVWDIIGRSVVLYRRELQNMKDAVACAVIARSSVPGAGGARQLCSCDGTVIWQCS